MKENITILRKAKDIWDGDIFSGAEKKYKMFNIKYKQTGSLWAHTDILLSNCYIFPHLHDLITFYWGKYFNNLIQQLGIRSEKSFIK